MCKKQTSVSHSSTESEIISLDAGLRMDGLLALDFRDVVVKCCVQLAIQRNPPDSCQGTGSEQNSIQTTIRSVTQLESFLRTESNLCRGLGRSEVKTSGHLISARTRGIWLQCCSFFFSHPAEPTRWSVL